MTREDDPRLLVLLLAMAAALYAFTWIVAGPPAGGDAAIQTDVTAHAALKPPQTLPPASASDPAGSDPVPAGHLLVAAAHARGEI